LSAQVNQHMTPSNATEPPEIAV